MIFALFLFCVVVYMIIKVVVGLGIAVKKTTSTYQNVKNDIRIYSEIMEENERTERCQILPERQTFLFTQSSAIESFIKDREIGTNYDWDCYDKGLLNVYLPNQKGKLYYVTFSCNKENKAEIELFNALDGSFRYDAREKSTVDIKTGNNNYFNSKVFSDTDYLNELQEQVSKNDGIAICDAKRFNGGKPLTADEMDSVAKALPGSGWEVVDIDYDNCEILIKIANGVDEDVIEEAEKEVDKHAFYRKKIQNDGSYMNEILSALHGNGGSAAYDAKRYNNGETLSNEDIRVVMDVLSERDDLLVEYADFENSLIAVSLNIF